MLPEPGAGPERGHAQAPLVAPHETKRLCIHGSVYVTPKAALVGPRADALIASRVHISFGFSRPLKGKGRESLPAL